MVIEAFQADEDLLSAFQRLVPQLSRSASLPSLADLREVVGSPCSVLLLARDRANEEILGTVTLVLFRTPTGLRAWIEDVVVDSGARGRGVGESLNREALRIAGERGAATVDLTSRPAREEANRLYRRIGFVSRDTNVYRFELSR